ncbi:hypothetical protein C3L33_12181, partial [Rhododendron williamsianum]
MDTLLKTHNKLEFLHPLHGFVEKTSGLSPSKPHSHELKFVPNKPNLKLGKNFSLKAKSSALLELVPETKKENLDFELPISWQTLWEGKQEATEIQDDAEMHIERCEVSSGQGYKSHHEESKSLLICNDGVTIQAAVVLDATGFSRCLVQYDKPYNPGYQVAYGILAEVEEHPFDVNKMVFMDWRDSHLDNNRELKERNSRIPTFLYAMPFSSSRIFLEETSLVARPGLSMEDIQERMEARLRHLGIKVKSIEEDEHCVIPMGGPLPVLPQRVVGLAERLEWSTLQLDIWSQGL